MTRQEAVDFLELIKAEHAADRLDGPAEVRVDLATQAHAALRLLDDLPDWAIEERRHFGVSISEPDDYLGVRYPFILFTWMRTFRFNPGNKETYVYMNGNTNFGIRSSFLEQVVSLPPPIEGRARTCGQVLGPAGMEVLEKVLALQMQDAPPAAVRQP